MARHAETRRLPYAPEQMFDLVADIARYPEFLPWVSAARVRADRDEEAIADLVVGFSGFRERFTSRVVKRRPTNLSVDYMDGPLKYLKNDWTFASDGAGGCDVAFSVDFAFRSRVLDAMANQFFNRALQRIIAAFEARATQLYSAGASGISSSSAHSAA